jgi:hypothetical protein
VAHVSTTRGWRAVRRRAAIRWLSSLGNRAIPVSASGISRTDSESSLDTTDDTLGSAFSSSFSIRCQQLARSRVRSTVTLV